MEEKKKNEAGNEFNSLGGIELLESYWYAAKMSIKTIIYPPVLSSICFFGSIVTFLDGKDLAAAFYSFLFGTAVAVPYGIIKRKSICNKFKQLRQINIFDRLKEKLSLSRAKSKTVSQVLTRQKDNSDNSLSSSINSEDRVQELLSKINELEKRLAEAEARNEAIKKLVLNYLEVGGTNPLTNNNISKEELIKILIGYNVKTPEQKKRRNNMLKSLGVGTLAFIAIALSLKSDSSKDFKNNIEPSNKIIVTRTEKRILPIEKELIIEKQESEMPSLETDNLKSNEEIALEVIQGSWRNGEERKYLLEEAGYDYGIISSLVNDIYYNRLSLEEIYSKIEAHRLNR